MPSVIVLGKSGQLASCLRDLTQEKDFRFIGSDEINFLDLDSLDEKFASLKADWIVNCMAYTSVDKAEFEPENARKINAFAPEKLAQHCRRENIPLIHISTDFVFDGEFGRPYVEDDKCQPRSVYGRTKMEGEDHILAIQPNAYILRTSWLYSEYGHNFVKTILRLIKEKDQLTVVSDQIGTPTDAHDLAKEIVFLTESRSVPRGTSIFHYSNQGVASWYDFAYEIGQLTNSKTPLTPIPSRDYRTSAKRPANSVLDKSKYMAYFNRSIPYWRDSLRACLERGSW